MKKALFVLCNGLLLFFGCTNPNTQESNRDTIGSTPIPIFQDIDVEAFSKLMQQENIVLLDVRTPPEIAAGKIEDAVELDFKAKDFRNELRKLDRDKTYLVYCRSGRRSALTGQMMADLGFKDVYNLKGGILAWQKNQKEIK